MRKILKKIRRLLEMIVNREENRLGVYVGKKINNRDLRPVRERK